jgi:hypothetical protein
LKSYENSSSAQKLKKNLTTQKPLPFEEEEEDFNSDINADHVTRGRLNRSEVSNKKSSSRSHSSRYRSKSEDVYEKRKYDVESEEMSRVTQGVK